MALCFWSSQHLNPLFYKKHASLCKNNSKPLHFAKPCRSGYFPSTLLWESLLLPNLFPSCLAESHPTPRALPSPSRLLPFASHLLLTALDLLHGSFSPSLAPQTLMQNDSPWPV